MKPLLTADEVAEILKVSRQTVWRWIREGKIRAARLGGTQAIRIRQEDLEAFIEGEKREG